MSNKKLLLVEDEPALLFAISNFLGQQGWEVEETDTCEAGLEKFRTTRPDAVLIDFSLPDGTALTLLRSFKEIDATIPVVVLTAHNSVDLAVQTIKEGAENFLTKPIELSTLQVILNRLLENQRKARKEIAVKSQQAQNEVDPFIGTSEQIMKLKEAAGKVAASNLPVLILGDTGTGKSVLARWIHRHSPRSEEAFVELNCAGLSKDFLETELFGHEKGAFTGAVQKKMGLLEVAHHGTVFLDEFGDVDLQVQPKLLKVLEEKKFRKMGEVRERTVDVRLIAATNLDLVQAVQEKRFRSDLYFRINTIQLRLPALRERREDIPLLANDLLARLSAKMRRGNVEFTSKAMSMLQNHSWSGNIRELHNVLERALLLSDGGEIDHQSLFFDGFAGTTQEESPTDTNLTLEELEERHIRRILQEEKGNVVSAASRLGISRSSLYQKIKRYALE
jgi:DNA-binding NtrC family response regulator